MPDEKTCSQSVGDRQVLPPETRDPENAYGVASILPLTATSRSGTRQPPGRFSNGLLES